MAALRVCLRAGLRARWRAWLAAALLVGIAGGVVLTTAAGARRTGSAYPRFLRASHVADMLVSPNATGFPDYYRALAREPGVAITPVIGFGVAPVQTPAHGLLIESSPDPRWGTSVERPKITSGRMFRPGDATEVVANTTAARSLHLQPGSRLRLLVATSNEMHPNPRDETITVQVVGLAVTRDDVVSVNALADAPRLLAGLAFSRLFGPDHYAFDGANVALAPGVSKATFTATAQTLGRRFPETGGSVLVADGSEQAAKVEHAIRPQAVALGLFAALTALTALFLLGQLLARQLYLASTENPTLRELGMSRRQLFTLGIVEVGAIAVVGALIATAIAVVASPTMPIGPARLAEPRPGVSVDWLVIASGFVFTVALLVARAAWPAWQAARAGDPRGAYQAIARRQSRITRWATATGVPPTAAIGVGYATDPGRGRTAVPDRGAIAVTALAVA
ncbi:MAG TPA: ABC transporter permease, partial [Acidimicrobiia bacterium]|nr:ABC transporter permease [Acidimicrobiia bacterium]